MSAFITAVEAVGSTLGGVAIVAKPTVKWLNKRNRERVIDDLFMHGSDAIPGVRAALMPASERLSGVETGLVLANSKLDHHGQLLERLNVTVKAVDSGVKTIVADVHGGE